MLQMMTKMPVKETMYHSSSRPSKQLKQTPPRQANIPPIKEMEESTIVPMTNRLFLFIIGLQLLNGLEIIIYTRMMLNLSITEEF